MPWQRARFLSPTPYPEPFWVMVGRPEYKRHPPLKDDMSGFALDDIREGFWYRTNVLEPRARFLMWAPHDGVELIAEFADEIEPDTRFVIKEPTDYDH